MLGSTAKWPLRAVALILSLSGCASAEYHSIHRLIDTNEDSHLIDAKQRVLVARKRPLLGLNGKPIEYEGQPLTTSSFCAEPGPDALQATAAALSVAGGGEAKEIEAFLNAAFSSGESAASFGIRTETIQLLRDVYYRLCEAAQNDHIDAIDYSIAQRQFQNQTVAQLAIAQLAGVEVGAQVRLAAAASADAGADLAALQKAIGGQIETVAAAEAELTAANRALEEAKAKLEAASAIPASDSTKAEKVAKRTKDVETAEARVAAAETKVKLHRGMLSALNMRIAGNQQDSIISLVDNKSETTPIRNSQGIVGETHSDAVVNAIRAITISAMNQDYEMEVCVQAMRLRNHSERYKSVIQLGGKGGASATPAEVKTPNFVEFCQKLFSLRAGMASAEYEAVVTRNYAIEDIVEAATRANKEHRLDADAASRLLLAIDHTTPVEEGARFLRTSLRLRDSSVAEAPRLDQNEANGTNGAGSEYRDKPNFEAAGGDKDNPEE